MSDLKRVLLSLMAIGALCAITIPRTYAVFNAETKQNPATVQTGTFVIGNSTNGGADCDSQSGASNNKNATCSALMTYSTSNEYYPGGPAATATVTIKAKGTLGTDDLIVDMPSCAKVGTGDAPVAQQGSVDPCTAAGQGNVTLTILETTPGNVRCVYPNTGPTCAPSTTNDLYNFFNLYPNTSLGLDLGSGPASGATRTFTVTFAIPSTAVAGTQGVSTQFTLEWFAQNGPD